MTSEGKSVESELAATIEETLWFGDDDPERSIADASKSLAAAVGKAAGLRPFPPLAGKLIALLNRTDYQSSEILRLIESDPGMASRVLGVANSAAFMSTSNCENLEQALLRLGAQSLRDIVAGVAVVSMFEESAQVDPTNLRKRVRAHCVGVAAVARALAALWRYRDAEQVFLAGLMHDLGKLLSLQTGEISYHEFPQEEVLTVNRTHLLERAAVGYDHAVLAAHVLEQWNFPQNVQLTVAWHHQPGRAYQVGGEVALMVALLRVADAIDVQMTKSRDYCAEFGEELLLDGTLEFADFSIGDLEEHWPRLLDARDQVSQIMGAK